MFDVDYVSYYRRYYANAPRAGSHEICKQRYGFAKFTVFEDILLEPD